MTSRWSISKLLCSVHTSLALLKVGGGEAETSSFWNLIEMLSVTEQRERQKYFWPISQFGISSFYSHSHVSSERHRRRFSALQQPWSCFHALPEGPLSVMLIWQWRMPTRRDYTFPQAPGTEPAMFLVILCPCWLIGAQRLFPRNPPFLIPPSCLSLVPLHLVACGFTSLLPVLYGSVPLKQDKNKKSILSVSLIGPFLSEATRQPNEHKPISFTGRWWPPSGCLDFLGFALVLIWALIEFIVYLSFLVCFILSLSLCWGLHAINKQCLSFKTVFSQL